MERIRWPDVDITEERTEKLHLLSTSLCELINMHGCADVTFICTHNSRRSQAAQLLMNHFCSDLDVPIRCWSGGTEETSFNPRMVTALRSHGFDLITHNLPSDPNPHYVMSGKRADHQIYFSKVYDRMQNPRANFVAVMLCQSAHESCPVVHGASFRHYLPFEDPKLFDDTVQEVSAYYSRVLQIGGELAHVVRLVGQSSY